MKKQDLEYYINLAMSTGADFADIYYEKLTNRTYRLNDSKLDTIDSNDSKGIGIRLTKDEESYYTNTNNFDKENITNIIKNIIVNISDKPKNKINLKRCINKMTKVEIPHNKFPINQKKDLMYLIDRTARNYSKLVKQVSVVIIEQNREFMVANSNSKYVKGNNILTRIVVTIYVEKDNIKEHESIDFAAGSGYKMLDNCKIEETIKKVTQTAIEKLSAIDFKGGEMPVIIAPGFGAVIFHEACGHGLEATSVAPHLSVFSDDLNKKIATKKVTLIDDGTIKNSWGGFTIDDEGNKSQKNILIDNGILKNYLVDQFHSKKMKCNSNGCGRRQNYKYSPTSRMSNTYLLPGNDKIEDMIKSIKYGVYCEKMSGGSVNPATGDFNFAVDTARLIENGEIKSFLKGITLIGNSKNILNNVEMVSDDLLLSAGFCGSKSGLIPVMIGQPTIKVSKILVGGKG